MSGTPDPVETMAAGHHEGREGNLRAWCLSEMSVAGLVAGALGLCAVLWLAVLAVL